MSPQCLRLVAIFLSIAVPLTVLCWGGFWWGSQRWAALVWTPSERRLFRWLTVMAGLIVAELAVLVCVAADR